ncbi:MAG: DUF167 domain-containing protein [Bacteroidetes bacterium]|jgi:uncharacterized protein YggU (UPF0235/DUF167 family)|nr:DUF167 domain-containing protein [Bacteroidota bacterium]
MRNADHLDIRDTPDGAVLAVKVVPGSSRNNVVGVLGGALKVATSAAPEKGKANAAVARLLAKALGLDTRQIGLAAGATNARKEFCVKGIAAATLRRRLSQL